MLTELYIDILFFPDVPLPNTDGRDTSLEDLDELKARLGLMMVDGCRKTHPDTRNFTFHRGTGEQATLSHLDRIYVSDEIYHFALRWTIEESGLKTDHSLASVQLTTPNAPKVGTGRPVFPLHLLKSKSLTKKMKKRGLEAEEELNDLKTGRVLRTEEHNPQTILFRMKTEWMETARNLERDTVPKLIAEIEELQRDLKAVRADVHRSDQVKAHDVNALLNRIGQLKAKRYKQQQQRSRAKHRLEGESPTKYWVRLHRAQTPRDLIPAFEREQGPDAVNTGNVLLETDAEQMAEMARAHHDSIQADSPEVTPPDVREQDIQKVLDSLDATVSNEQAASMASAISYDDCEMALRFAKSGTAPGLDGVQYEVWKTVHARFVEDSRHEGQTTFDVLAIIHAAFDNIQTHGVSDRTAFAQGWMAPIYKEKGELTKIVNYRPITLLNSDYKLLSKVLAICLAEVAPDIVHPAQAGFVPGRRFHNHTQLARMMMLCAEVKEVNGAIVALDQEKAYDKISHHYLWRVLERFGIPAVFTDTVKALYKEAFTSVMVNGAKSTPVKTPRGASSLGVGLASREDYTEPSRYSEA